jgi:hypothetical protein
MIRVSILGGWRRDEQYKQLLIWIDNNKERVAWAEPCISASYVDGREYPTYLHFTHMEDVLMCKLLFSELFNYYYEHA